MGGESFLVQARPVTTRALAPSPASALSPGRIPTPPVDDTWGRENELPAQPCDLWTRVNIGENLPFPVTPLTETNMLVMFLPDSAPPPPGSPAIQPMRRLYGRLYSNEGGLLQSIANEWGLPAAMVAKSWGAKHSTRPQLQGGFRPLRLLGRFARWLASTLLPGKGSKFPRGPEAFFAQIDRWVRESEQRDLRALDDRALWEAGLPVWRKRGQYAFSEYLRINVSAGIGYALLENIVKKWLGRQELTPDLVTSLSGV